MDKNAELKKQLAGQRLSTAHILYHMPDHPGLLQAFTWQTYDVAPRYPRIREFLDFWADEIDARIHSVTVGAVELVKPAELALVDAQYRLH